MEGWQQAADSYILCLLLLLPLAIHAHSFPTAAITITVTSNTRVSHRVSQLQLVYLTRPWPSASLPLFPCRRLNPTTCTSRPTPYQSLVDFPLTFKMRRSLESSRPILPQVCYLLFIWIGGGVPPSICRGKQTARCRPYNLALPRSLHQTLLTYIAEPRQSCLDPLLHLQHRLIRRIHREKLRRHEQQQRPVRRS